MFITAAGQQAIGLGAAECDGRVSEPAVPTDTNYEATTAPVASTGQLRAGSKAAQVLDLLHRPAGATLDELVAATGWLPHTTRAALTGLRKKGHVIKRGKRDEVTCYTAEVAA